MSLASIGAITISFHGDPGFSWSAAPTSRSGNACTISGRTDWTQAHQLRELVGNPAAQTTVGDATGVLEWVIFSDALLSPLTGYYLLSAFTMSPNQVSSLGVAPVAFTISAAYLGAVA